MTIKIIKHLVAHDDLKLLRKTLIFQHDNDISKIIKCHD